MSPDPNLDKLLAEHPFTQGLAEAHLTTLAGCAKNVFFKAGEAIVREGGPADVFYLLRHGLVALDAYDAAKGPLTVMTLTAPDVLGWSWLVQPYKWRFDARAVEPTRALALDAVCLRTKCEADHELGYQLLSRLTIVMESRLQATRLQMLDLYGTGARRDR
jgi:CRP-like cAMP-binding protein